MKKSSKVALDMTKKRLSYGVNETIFKHNQNLEPLRWLFFGCQYSAVPYVLSCNYNEKGGALVVYFTTKTAPEIDEEYNEHVSELHKAVIVNKELDIYDYSNDSIANTLKLAFIKCFLKDIKINAILDASKKDPAALGAILDSIILSAFNRNGFVDVEFGQRQFSRGVNIGKRYLYYLDTFAHYWSAMNFCIKAEEEGKLEEIYEKAKQEKTELKPKKKTAKKVSKGKKE